MKHVLAALLFLCVWAVLTNAQAPTEQKKSPAASIGAYVYPKNNQTAEQQAKDEQECYDSAHQQTGIDPTAPPPEVEAQKQKGGGAKGAARGAAGGAAVGAIADDEAGTGAAAGATAGAVRGRRQQKKANKEAEKQAQQQSASMQQQNLDTFRRAFSACIDARGYSVK